MVASVILILPEALSTSSGLGICGNEEPCSTFSILLFSLLPTQLFLLLYVTVHAEGECHGLIDMDRFYYDMSHRGLDVERFVVAYPLLYNFATAPLSPYSTHTVH